MDTEYMKYVLQIQMLCCFFKWLISILLLRKCGNIIIYQYEALVVLILDFPKRG